MKAVIIGCGSMGLKHRANLESCDIEIVAAADPDFASVPPGIPKKYREPLRAIEEHAPGNIVVIAGPTEVHAEQTRAACEAGALGIYVEKPPAVTVDEWRPIVELAAAKNIRGCIGFNFRYHTVFRKLFAAPPDPQTVLILSANDDVKAWPSYGPKSYTKDARSGGVLLTSLSHNIDMAIHLLGPAEKLSAAFGYDAQLTDADSQGVIVMLHQGGARSLSYVNWDRPPSAWASRLNAMSGATVSLMDDQWATDRAQMHGRTMQAFLAYVETGDPGSLCLFADGLEVMRVIAAARRSWEIRSGVDV